jgi:hypothetical protein
LNASWKIGSEATGTAVWRGPDLAERSGEWTIHLSRTDIEEIDSGLATVKLMHGDKSWSQLETDAVFPLPGLTKKLRPANRILRDGVGFLLLRGLPVERYSLDDAKTVLRGISACFGESVSQNHRGDMIGEVIDRSDEIAEPRLYEAGGEFRMHVDPIDIVGLMCLRKAKRGGDSRIVSSLTVHNILHQERPELASILYEGFRLYRPYPDRGNTQPLTPRTVPVFAPDQQNRFAAYFLPDPALQAVAREGVNFSAQEQEALEHAEHIAARDDLILNMPLVRGDIQFLNNRVILHSRADYEDFPEKERRRMMLRIWLMNPQWGPLCAKQVFFDQSHRLGGGITPASQVSLD